MSTPDAAPDSDQNPRIPAGENVTNGDGAADADGGGAAVSVHLILDSQLAPVAYTPSLSELAGDGAADNPINLVEQLLGEQHFARFQREARAVCDSGRGSGWQLMKGGWPLEVRLQALRGTEGGQRVVAVAISSATRVAEERRRAGFEAALDVTPVGVLIVEDAGAQTITANPSATEILGAVPAGVNEDEAQAVVIQRNGRRSSLNAWLKRRRRRFPRGRSEELRIERPSGTSVDVLAALAPLVDRSGARQGLIVTLTDVSEQKALQQVAEIRAVQEETIAELGLYALSEPRVDRVMKRICSRLSQILDVEFCKVLRILDDSDELLLQEGVGWKAGTVRRVVERMNERSEAAYVLSVNEPVVVDDHRTEQRFAMPELLAQHDIVSSVSVVVTAAAGPYGVLGVHSRQQRRFMPQDTAILQAAANVLSAALLRAHLEQQLIDSREQLAKAESQEQMQRAARLAALGTLAAGIAHEINNPLNSMLMNAELGLMASRDGDARVRELFTRIVEDCKRSARITEGVLMFARGERKPRERHVNLNDVVSRARELAASIAQLRDMSIDLDLGKRLPGMTAHSTELEQVVINLIKNAGEAGATSVTIGTSCRNGRLRLVVSDNGPGIPEGDLPRLFDPFFSTRREKGGTGLGLSLVHRIVSDHRGSIAAQNRGEGGASFVIHLPVGGNQ